MTKKKKRKEPVDVLIERVDYPDRAKGFVLESRERDQVDAFLELDQDDLRSREKIARMHARGGIEGQIWRALPKRSREGMKMVDLLELLEASPLEKKSFCPHFAKCGACSYQTLPYETELLLKQGQIERLFEEYKIEVPSFGIKPSPRDVAYRNKVEYSFGDQEKGGKLVLGLHRKGAFFEILPTYECKIVTEDCNRIRKAVEEFSRSKSLSYFHKMRKEGYLRHLVVRLSFSRKEIMLNLVTTSQEGLDEEGMAEFVRSMLALDLDFTITSIYHTINDSLGDVVQADKLCFLCGKKYLTEEMLGLTFHIGPFSFFQPNVFTAQRLYAQALDLAGDLSGKTVYDLYSGTGTISQIFAKKAQRVIGVEIVEEAVEKAKESAELNGLANVKFICQDVLKEIDSFIEKEDIPDLLVMDPPREGINPKALKKILSMRVEKIIYISCNPRSLARDLQTFQNHDYRVEKLQLYDQFPRTKHVETVALLSKLDVDKHINIEIELDELDLTSAESKATYAQIKEYVWNKFELKVPTLYIAQIKRKCGIELREHYNKSKKENQIIPQCTPEKEEAIMDALRHFKMI